MRPVASSLRGGPFPRAISHPHEICDFAGTPDTRAPVFPTPRNPRVSRGPRVDGPGAFGPQPGTRPVRAGWRPPISRRHSSTASWWPVMLSIQPVQATGRSRCAGVAKLADAGLLKSPGLRTMWVRVPPPAPSLQVVRDRPSACSGARGRLTPINLEPRVLAGVIAARSRAAPRDSGAASIPGPASPCGASGTARGEACR